MKNPITLLITCIAALPLTAPGGAHTKARPAPEPVRFLIENVSVWDGTSDRATPGQDVLIVGNLVESIGADLTAGGNATIIDGVGHIYKNTLSP